MANIYNPAIFNGLRQMFGPTASFWTTVYKRVLVGVNKNAELFRAYQRSAFKKHYDVNDALADLALLDRGILIHFTDLHLYAIVDDPHKLMDFVEYTRFISTSCSINIKQVIPVDHAQKPVFISTIKDGRIAMMLRRQFTEILNVDVSAEMSHGRLQFTIEKVVENYGAALNIFGDVMDSASTLVETLKMIPVRRRQNVDFITPSINKIYHASNLNELVRSFKHMMTDTIIAKPVSIDDINPIELQCIIVSSWIMANPPGKYEYKKTYHKRFRDECESHMGIRRFNALLIKLGYSNVLGKKGLHWRK